MNTNAFPIAPNAADAAQVAALVRLGISANRARCILTIAAGEQPNVIAAASAESFGLVTRTDVPSPVTPPIHMDPIFDLTDEGRRLVAAGCASARTV